MLPAAPSGLHINSSTIGSPQSTDYLDWTDNDDYDYVELWYSVNGSAYSLLDADVTQGDGFASDNNYTYGYKVRGFKDSIGSAFSNAVTVSHWEDTKTTSVHISVGVTTYYSGAPEDYEDTIVNDIGIGVEIIEGGDFDDTWTNYITIESSVTGVITGYVNYRYYLGTNSGMVAEYDDAYYADNGVSIDSYWRSKTVISADVFPNSPSDWMTLYKAQVWYVDLTENTPMILSVSTDGGVTWQASTTRYLGNGDGMVKREFFHFVKHGGTFDFKIESPSADKKFQIIRLVGFFSPGGEAFGVS